MNGERVFGAVNVAILVVTISKLNFIIARFLKTLLYVVLIRCRFRLVTDTCCCKRYGCAFCSVDARIVPCVAYIAKILYELASVQSFYFI